MFALAKDDGFVLTQSPPPSCLAGYYVQVVLIMFFLFSSDIFITLRYDSVCLLPLNRLIRSSSQDICDNFRKEDIRDLLWDPGVGKANSGARDFFHQATGNRKLHPNPGRRYQDVCDHRRPPVQAGSEFDCYRVWWAVPIPGPESQRLLTTGKRLESSAFLVIIWYTYRNKSTLKFSALIRTMVTEATIYFLAMVALQTYVQLSLSLTKVYSLCVSLPTS